MDYFGIVKQSWKLTLKNKFLWIFGIFAGGYGGLKGFNTSNYSATGTEWSKSFGDLFSSSNLNDFWIQYSELIISILVFFGIIAIVFFVLNIISQGALVSSVEKIHKGEKADFYKGLDTGWHQFWRIWGLGLMFLLMILASLIVLVAPVSALVASGDYAIAITLGVLILFVCIAFWIIIGIISPYALRIVVLEKKSVFESIRESLHLFQRNWVEVIVMYLILFAIGVAFGIALALALVIAGGILAAIGLGLWLASPFGAVIYGILVGLIVFAIIIAIGGAFNSFNSSILTLMYLKLKK